MQDKTGTGRLIVEYFNDLFSTPSSNYEPVVNLLENKVTNDINNGLLAPFKSDEFLKAIFQMHLDKSPGLDGLNPTFYQKVMMG